MPDKAAQSEVSLAAALSFHKEGRTLQEQEPPPRTPHPSSQRGRRRALLVQASPKGGQVQKGPSALELRVWGKWEGDAVGRLGCGQWGP